MGATTRHGYPWPVGSELPAAPAQIRALADAVDKQVPYVSTVEPPKVSGLIWYNPTTKNTLISDGSVWMSVNTNGISYSNMTTEVSVTAGNVSLIPLTTPNAAYYTVAGTTATVRTAGIWALSLHISAGVAGDIPLIGAITTPARNAWDGRTYTGRSVDWNSVSRASASWTGHLAVDETFGFYRANKDTVARMMSTAYTIAFVSAS